LDGGDQERPGIKINSELVVAKIWSVSFFEDNGVDQTATFSDVYLEFQPNFRLAVIDGCETYEGEWILSSDSTLLVIRMSNAQVPLNQLDDEWVITRLTETELRIIEQDDKGDEEFHFKTAPLRALSCEDCQDFTNTAADSIWSVTLFKNNLVNQTDELRGSYLRFNVDGTFLFESNSLTYNGDWAVTDNCEKLVLEWTEEPPSSVGFGPLDREWYVDHYDSELMEFYAADESEYELQLTKGLFPHCSEESEALHNTSWFIKKVIINSDDVSDQFRGTGFTFLTNNQLATEVIVGPAVLGSWMFTGDCDEFVLDSRLESLQELNRQWLVLERSNQVIKLEFEENTLKIELELASGIPVIMPWCNNLINILQDTKWKVDSFIDNEEDQSSDFSSYQFDFNAAGSLVITDDNQQIDGQYGLVRGCQVLDLDLDLNGPLGAFNGNWILEEFNSYEIRLIYSKGDQTKELVLVHC